jgi:DNA-binding MarR family transcriptional regulator
MKYTQTTLEKTEKILEESGYVIRYERGTFQSGYCILEQRKVVVLIKFLQTEGRINTLIDIIPQLKVDAALLTPEIKKLYQEIMAKQTQSNVKI